MTHLSTIRTISTFGFCLSSPRSLQVRTSSPKTSQNEPFLAMYLIPTSLSFLHSQQPNAVLMWLWSIGYSKENFKIHTRGPLLSLLPSFHPLPSLPHLPLSLPPLPLPLPLTSYIPFPSKYGPLNPARGSGSAVSSQAGSGVEPQLKSILVHFSLKIWHLVATILMILLRINSPNFIPSPAKWFLKIHNLTFNDAKIDFNDTQFV